MAEAPENWIVRIEGKISGDRMRQTYELDQAELAITTPGLVPVRSGRLFALPAGHSFELKGRIKEAQAELIHPTNAEVNAALADAYRLRQAVRAAVDMLSAETWGGAKAMLEAALR